MRTSTCAVAGVTLLLIGITAGSARAVTTVPVLWTAGGLDAGTTVAGQAARMTVDASGNVAVVSGPSGGRDLAVTSYTSARADGQIVREGDLRWDTGDDLAVRAALALRQATGCRLGASIRVTKNIPAGSGMGGGSSDAATTLIALNRLWGLGLARPALAAIALPLGADVPLFLQATMRSPKELARNCTLWRPRPLGTR